MRHWRGPQHKFMTQRRATYFLFAGLGLYSFVSALALGAMAQTQGLILTCVTGAVLTVIGVVAYEMFERRSFAGKTAKSFSFIQSRQEDMLNDIARLRSKQGAPSRESEISLARHNDNTESTSKFSPRVDIAYQDFTKDQIASFLRHAVGQREIEVFAQPVVTLPQRQTYMMEVYACLKTPFDQTVGGTDYLDVARDNDLMAEIDQLLLSACLEKMQDNFARGKATRMVFNIEDRSLLSPDYMSVLLTFIAKNKELARFLTFEIAQSGYTVLDEKAAIVLKQLARLGCTFSMDHVEDPHLDKDMVRDMGISYIKIGADKLVRFTRDENSIAVMHRIKNQFEAQGVKLIAEKVEDEEMLKDILDLELDYGEGFVFGRPDRLDHFEFQRSAA